MINMKELHKALDGAVPELEQMDCMVEHVKLSWPYTGNGIEIFGINPNDEDFKSNIIFHGITGKTAEKVIRALDDTNCEWLTVDKKED